MVPKCPFQFYRYVNNIFLPILETQNLLFLVELWNKAPIPAVPQWTHTLFKLQSKGTQQMSQLYAAAR